MPRDIFSRFSLIATAVLLLTGSALAADTTAEPAEITTIASSKAIFFSMGHSSCWNGFPETAPRKARPWPMTPASPSVPYAKIPCHAFFVRSCSRNSSLPKATRR